MTASNRKKISELEQSLYGKKIEVVGKIVEQLIPSFLDRLFYARLQDAQGKWMQLQGRKGLLWKNELERTLEEALATNIPVIVKGNYHRYGWSDALVHCITVEEMKLVDYLHLVK